MLKSCLVCNKDIFICQSKVDKGWGKYCSIKCRGIAKRKHLGISKICKYCHNLFSLKRTNQTYCSVECVHMSTVGKARPQSVKDAVSKANKGRVSPNKGKKYPELSGENSPRWNGGTTKRAQKRVSKPEWKELRKIIYERDNWTCQRCKKKVHKGIQCHHKNPWETSHNNDVDNLVTLCTSCHMIVEWEYIKKGIIFIC